ncbi:MAG: hypothetical protein UR26_C0002G0191 [candidate division TM6 bacterium GW2011_GWF2_32_72]|nr:MAG: hypothetical protein UR26_C0002G0191 [candidate division TM6 bacterium GW2011_GWF2_32_72]
MNKFMFVFVLMFLNMFYAVQASEDKSNNQYYVLNVYQPDGLVISIFLQDLEKIKISKSDLENCNLYKKMLSNKHFDTYIKDRPGDWVNINPEERTLFELFCFIQNYYSAWNNKGCHPVEVLHNKDWTPFPLICLLIGVDCLKQKVCMCVAEPNRHQAFNYLQSVLNFIPNNLYDLAKNSMENLESEKIFETRENLTLPIIEIIKCIPAPQNFATVEVPRIETRSVAVQTDNVKIKKMAVQTDNSAGKKTRAMQTYNFTQTDNKNSWRAVKSCTNITEEIETSGNDDAVFCSCQSFQYLDGDL